MTRKGQDGFRGRREKENEGVEGSVRSRKKDGRKEKKNGRLGEEEEEFIEEGT